MYKAGAQHRICEDASHRERCIDEHSKQVWRSQLSQRSSTYRWLADILLANEIPMEIY